MNYELLAEDRSDTRSTDNLHLNLFYVYGAAHLENNVTRALLITLRGLTPVHLRIFLKELIIDELKKQRGVSNLCPNFKILADPKPDKFEFLTQISTTGDTPFLTKKNGVILGINHSGDQAIKLGPSNVDKAGSRPDAVIMDMENELTVIIEVKLSDLLYSEQIERLHRNFFVDDGHDPNAVFLELSWQRIASALQEILLQSQSPVERMLIREFLEYLALLNLSGFIEFNKADFPDRNYYKLNSFLISLSKELPQSLRVQKYAGNHKLYLEDDNGKEYADNLYVGYGKDGMEIAIVCGAGKKWRAQQLYNFLKSDSGKIAFNSIVNQLQLNLVRIDPLIRIQLPIHSYFRLSFFRTEWLGNIRGFNDYPQDYEKFRETFTDAQLNTFGQMDKMAINSFFAAEISANEGRLDSSGRFPGWDDADVFNQYCYFSVQSIIPQNLLIRRTKSDLMSIFEQVIQSMKGTIEELSAIH